MTAITILFALGFGFSQNESEKDLPYFQIPDYPEEYTAGSVVSRMIDGLGFRYYWATEGLTEQDLTYKPSEEGRETIETIEHIYGLSKTIINAAKKIPNVRGTQKEELSFAEMRKETLLNLKNASDIFKVATDLNEYKMIFAGQNGATEYPMWNQINGPIADALWHCGQVVLMRRASGNPFNGKANVLTGKVRE